MGPDPGGDVGLSSRANALIGGAPMPRYLDEHFLRQRDPYEASGNPDGYIGLAVAENKLVWDLVRPRLQAPRPGLSHKDICYDRWIGCDGFRGLLAAFMGRRILGRAVDPAHLAVLAGAGSVLEILFFALADGGEGVLVPTPSYSGFWADLETRDALRIVPVHTRAEDGFRLTTRHLDEALASADRPVKALLYTNPSNPTGAVASGETIREVIEWSEERGVHLVLDEIYALSIHGDTPFVSGASLRAGLGENVHVVWAFSKDFGASGLRCGVLVTENEALMQAVNALAYWSVVSGDTQHVLGDMISDEEWVEGYVAGMQARLRESYQATAASLDRAGIRHFPAEGGFFLLCDLRDHLDEPTWAAEGALWRRILDRANVNLTPGAACRCVEPGFMRICFAAVPVEAAVEAIRRIGSVLG